MDLAVITAQQVAELFILIGLGALGAKTGLLRPEGKQTLSNLLVNLVVPAMIINSYRMEFSAEILHNLMAAFALSTLSILLGLIITLLFTARSRDSRTPIFRFACVFSNAGYMGLRRLEDVAFLHIVVEGDGGQRVFLGQLLAHLFHRHLVVVVGGLIGDEHGHLRLDMGLVLIVFLHGLHGGILNGL